MPSRSTRASHSRASSGACPRCPATPLRPGLTEDIDRLADEAGRVRFTPPHGFDSLAFVPLGIDRRRPDWPFDGHRVDRMLVVSPFVTPECLERLDRPRSAGRDILVTRPETFDELGAAAVARFGGTFTLSGDATSPEETDESEPETPDDAADEVTAERPDVELRGLHAKLFVADQGGRATVWTGSANATHGAFEGNVEFLVRLEGQRKRCGVDAIIGTRDDGLTLRSLLETYAPSSDEPEPQTLEERLENRLEFARRDLAALRFTGHVAAAGDDVHSLRLTGEAPRGKRARSDWSDITVRCRPLSMKAAYARLAEMDGADLSVDFGTVSFETLTSFFAFELETEEEGVVVKLGFLVNARLVGAPRDRRERVLASLLKTRGDLMRFLLFLLRGEPAEQLVDGARPVDLARHRRWLGSSHTGRLAEPLRADGARPGPGSSPA